MKHITLLATAAALMTSTSAIAQSASFGEGFYIDGYVELGYFDDGSTDDTFIRGDIDLGYAPSAGGFGLSLGIDGFGGSINDEIALYPAVSYSTNFGTFSVGIPRSVLDRGYMPEPKFGNGSYVDLEFRPVLASTTGAAYLIDDYDLLGVRYDGEFGKTKVGFSAHQLKQGSDKVDTYALALSHSLETSGMLGTVQLYGGIEHLRNSGESETNYRLGAEAVNGRTTGGITYSKDNVLFDASLLMGYVDYKLRDNITLTGTLGSIDTGSSTRNFYGIGAEYGFAQNGYVKASYVDATNVDYDGSWEVMVGWNF